MTTDYGNDTHAAAHGGEAYDDLRRQIDRLNEVNEELHADLAEAWGETQAALTVSDRYRAALERIVLIPSVSSNPNTNPAFIARAALEGPQQPGVGA